MKTKPGLKPSLNGPFYALDARDVTTNEIQHLVVTDSQAVCTGHFSSLAICHNWKDAVFVALACNQLLGLPGVRFEIPTPIKIDPDKLNY